MTIGDVLAVVVAMGLIGAGTAGLLLLLTYAFPQRVSLIETALMEKPSACIGRGVAILVILSFLVLSLEHQSAGLLRLCGMLMVCMIALAAAMGGAGIVTLVSKNILAHSVTEQPAGAVFRASVIFVLAGALPLIGWFLVVPISIVVSIGTASFAFGIQKNTLAEAAPVNINSPLASAGDQL